MMVVEEERSMEEGLLKLKNQNDSSDCRITACVILSTFVAVCGSFSFGVAVGYTSGAEIGIMQDIGLSIAEFSAFGSFSTLGATVGALLSGKMAIMLGRRGTMWVSNILCITGWLSIAFAKDVLWLDFGRISSGIGIGLTSYVVPVYIAEITPKHVRGTFTFSNQYAVEYAVQVYRCRRHRVAHLIDIEKEILKIRLQGLSSESDIRLWKGVGDSFAPHFSSQQTWQLTRIPSQKVNWYRAIWFTGATPKYSVITWKAVHDRLATGERIRKWSPNTDATCVMCQAHIETRDHLFFSCQYSQQIWMGLTKNLLRTRFTTDWNNILDLLANNGGNGNDMFLLRYVFQISIHTIWRERNGRKHGERPQTSAAIIKFIDKGVRNRITSLRMVGSGRFTTAMQAWFATRE